ncbi:unnamed protein product [Didymodactylos carnosus]|uniref:HRDC domain-containing protein n=1 Tax=Didymodactylos carnosus TaxID=1234261 RepID=A0A8S2E0Y3_9BILA|nr:unnamed protein product [Didymodactylos carnosus]CAF3824476.1 unnamed protein product [Didymodactylos carnosus]
MTEELQKENQIAVDLEQHSYRSYRGITCLVQISTRTTDYIIDALQLRDELHFLNLVFENPNIVKTEKIVIAFSPLLVLHFQIMHGSHNDILWLQRDGIKLKNLFDTEIAARELKFPCLSLKYLLKKICDVDKNEEYQMSDWRTRPLTENQINYARTDTHYLLVIYDILFKRLSDLQEKYPTIIQNVYAKCKLLSEKVYKAPVFEEKGYLKLMKDHKKNFNQLQLHVLKHLYAWRDRVARKHDESTGYVLNNDLLLKISEEAPRDIDSVYKCAHRLPVLVTQYIEEIEDLICIDKCEEPTPVCTIQQSALTQTIREPTAPKDRSQSSKKNQSRRRKLFRAKQRYTFFIGYDVNVHSYYDLRQLLAHYGIPQLNVNLNTDRTKCYVGLKNQEEKMSSITRRGSSSSNSSTQSAKARNTHCIIETPQADGTVEKTVIVLGQILNPSNRRLKVKDSCSLKHAARHAKRSVINFIGDEETCNHQLELLMEFEWDEETTVNENTNPAGNNGSFKVPDILAAKDEPAAPASEVAVRGLNNSRDSTNNLSANAIERARDNSTTTKKPPPVHACSLLANKKKIETRKKSLIYDEALESLSTNDSADNKQLVTKLNQLLKQQLQLEKEHAKLQKKYDDLKINSIPMANDQVYENYGPLLGLAPRILKLLKGDHQSTTARAIVRHLFPVNVRQEMRR